uniref:Uncharacterized protein n=1 Tax=Cacopsylla melanoneura TaxID=428564 RepID=A0A8D9FJS3_9HEMI
MVSMVNIEYMDSKWPRLFFISLECEMPIFDQVQNCKHCGTVFKRIRGNATFVHFLHARNEHCIIYKFYISEEMFTEIRKQWEMEIMYTHVSKTFALLKPLSNAFAQSFSKWVFVHAPKV